jgi:murein DD-endopeptidase MepM/ murein hydrolase activator NlpD
VRAGESAARGQVLGTVGASDPDLPAHLHFEVRPGGRAVDPLTLLR